MRNFFLFFLACIFSSHFLRKETWPRMLLIPKSYLTVPANEASMLDYEATEK